MSDLIWSFIATNIIGWVGFFTLRYIANKPIDSLIQSDEVKK